MTTSTQKKLTEDKNPPAKTSWDWLQLFLQIIAAIAVPASIIIGAWQFTTQQQNDREKSIDEQQQVTLQNYLNTMSNLLLKYNLNNSKPNDLVTQVAVAQTQTAVTNLDPHRKSILLQFLYESRLITISNNNHIPIISLHNADFRDISLSGTFNDISLASVNLTGAKLNKVNLSSSDLSNADLNKVNLSNADLSNADLSNAGISNSNLSDSILVNSNLSDTDLSYTNLSGSILNKSNLSGAKINGSDLSTSKISSSKISNSNLSTSNLSGADLSGADLSHDDLSNADLSTTDLGHADLSHADLSNADLSNADLSSANVTQEQWERASSLHNTTLPNGTKHS